MRALWLALAPAAFTLAPTEALRAQAERVLPGWWVVPTLSALLLVAAAARHRAGGLAWRLVASAGFLLSLGGALLARPEGAGRGLVLLVGGVAFLAFVFPPERLRVIDHFRRSHPPELEAHVSAQVALLFGFDAWRHVADATLASTAALSVLFALPIAFGLGRDAPRRPTRRIALVLAALAAVVPLALLVLVQVRGLPFASLSGYAAVGLVAPLIVLANTTRRAMQRRLASQTRVGEPGLLDVVLINPARVLVLSFAALCALGTLLLALPVASASGVGLPLIDALFTAVSATCVTGLAVVDTPVAFSFVGQALVLVLIQVGGLGIMVFSAAAAVFLGRRMSLSHERAAVDLVGASGRAGLNDALRAIVLITLATEGVTALLLTGGFLARGDGLGEALWRGVFTAISAFCNAGFALQSDSLVGYADSPYTLAVVGVTIVVGGLGPAVVAALLAWRSPARRSLHARLVLWTTAILTVVPAFFVAALEWDNTLRGMGFVDKLANALFQSVTLRTAGFNSIDLAAVGPATWTLMILVMFVGGSPGSTAGGAKTTTLAVVVLAIVAVVRGRERIEVFGRTLPTTALMRATAVTTLGVLACCVGLGALQVTQRIPLEAALFEVVSALATVGLSVGATGQLDDIGKVIIIACMFAGRVGPLTLFVFLASASAERRGHRYPEENVPVG